MICFSERTWFKILALTEHRWTLNFSGEWSNIESFGFGSTDIFLPFFFFPSSSILDNKNYSDKISNEIGIFI